MTASSYTSVFGRDSVIADVIRLQRMLELDPPFREPPKPDPNNPGILIGGAVDDVSINLRIFGDGLDPDEITEILGVEPTSSCRKGDVFRGKRYDRVERTGRWLYGHDHTKDDVNSTVVRLLATLPNDLAIWHSITNRFSVDLFLGLWMRNSNRGFDLQRDTLQLLFDRRLEIGFDIYYGTSPPDRSIGNVG